MDPLHRVPLGRTAITVPRIGIGLRPIGDLPPERHEDALAVIRHALSVGVDHLDTAPVYGYGASESRLGEVLADVGRSRAVVSTKVGHVPRQTSWAWKVRAVARDSVRDPAALRDGVLRAARFGRRVVLRRGVRPPAQVRHDYGYDSALRSVEASLERLRTDRLDIAYIHDPDDDFEGALRGAYPALERLRSEGTVGAIGVAMNQAPMLAAFIREADLDVVLIAGRLTLLDATAATELLPLATQRRVAVVVGGVFNSGVLARPRADATFDYARVGPDVLRRVRRIDEICRVSGTTIRDVALAFPWRFPGVTAVLLGVDSPQEIDSNLTSLRTGVPESVWAELSNAGLLANPGRQAPVD